MSRPPSSKARRVVTLLLALALPALAVFAILRMHLEEDVLALLPAQDDWVEQYQQTLRHFAQADRLYFELSTDEADSARLREDAAQLRASLVAAGIDAAFDESPPPNPSVFPTLLPPLFTQADADALEAKLEPESVRRYLLGMLRRLQGHEAYGIKPLLAADPVGLSGLLHAKASPLLSGFEGVRPVDGGFLSADHRRLLFWIEPGFAFTDTRRGEAFIDTVDSVANAFRASHPKVTLNVTGGLRMSVDNARAVRHDTLRCTVVSVLGIALVCALAYRRRAWIPLTLLPSLLGMCAAILALAAAFDPISSIAIGLASIAIGVTVDYAIHVMFHLDHPRGARGLWLPVGVGALTTVAAFAVAATSPMDGYRQLGLLGIVGVLVSAGTALTLLPAWRDGSGGPVVSPRWTGAVARFLAWRDRQTKPLLALAVALTLVLGFGLTRLGVNGDLEAMNGARADTRAQDAAIQQNWGSGLGLSLVITCGDTLDEALTAQENIADELANAPGLERVQSLATILPGETTQADNLARWRAFWSPERIAQTRQTLTAAGHELGFTPEAFDAFWAMIESPRQGLSPATLDEAGLGSLTEGRLAEINGQPAVATFVKLRERADDAARLREALDGRAWVIDGRLFTRHIAALTIEWFRGFALWTTLAVAAILYLCYGSWRLTFAMLAPLALGLGWTLGAMGWSGIALTPVNCVFVVFVLGIAEDYAVFLVSSRLRAYRGQASELPATGGAILLSALTTLLGFGVLATAEHPVLREFGLTIALGLVLGLAAILTLTLPLTDAILRRAGESPSDRRRGDIARRYRFFGPYTEHYLRWKLRLDPIYARLPEHLPECGTLLDLGCGHGLLEHVLRAVKPQLEIVALDYDGDKLAAARRTLTDHPRVRFEQADFFETDFPAADAVVLIDALHYWPPERQVALLRKIRSALRPGGSLFLREALPEKTRRGGWVAWMEKLAVRTGHNRASGLHFVSRETMHGQLRAADFSSVRSVDDTGLGDNRLIIAQY